MFSLQLAQGGIVTSGWDSDRRVTYKKVERPETVSELIRFWHYNLAAIAPGYTLGNLFELLAHLKNPDELSGILACDVPAFMEEARKAWEQGFSDSEINKIIVSAHTDFEDPSEFEEPEALGAILNRHRLWWDVSGRGPMTEEPYEGYWTEHPEQKGQDISYALDFSSLSSILDKPLECQNTVAFYQEDFNQGPKLFETTISISLGEFIQALFWEIGFHGGPVARDERLEGLEERVEEVKEIEEGLAEEAKYLSEEGLAAKREEMGFKVFNADEWLEEMKQKRAAEHPVKRKANEVMSRHGASLCKTPKILGVVIEGEGEETHLEVLVSEAEAVLDVPRVLGGIKVGCRVVEEFTPADE